MNNKDLKQFTNKELSHFKHSELKLPNPPLLSDLIHPNMTASEAAEIFKMQNEYLKDLLSRIQQQNDIFE